LGRILSAATSDNSCNGRRPGLAIGDGFPGVLDAAHVGAPWAFERLYADLAPVVGGYLRVQGAAEPDDVTSEVFLGVFTGIGSFNGTETEFRFWVFRIAHRKLIDERRRLARRRWSPAGDHAVLDQTGGDVEAHALDVLGGKRVVQWCADLSADQRDVLVLRVVGDLTVEQVAAVVGKSTAAVKALQWRALSSLRQQLEKEGVPL
jgi:RNA polymerase sigma factor (sigma-70 family)